MTQDLWTRVDDYITTQVVAEDDVLRAVLPAADRAGLPQIAVTPAQGKLLYLVAKMLGARNVLEIGTLAGYSTIWLARAVGSSGRVVTQELDATHAAVARENFARAGLTNVELHVGRALNTLPTLQSSVPYDLVFIDADKENVPAYFDWAMKLTRPGAVIIVDNVVREGALIEADTDDARVLGVRRLHELIASDTRIEATTIQTVGAKGYDGLTIARVR